MALQRSAPNQSSSTLIPCSSSTTDTAVDFGFPATAVRIINDRASAIYLSFGTTTPSTGGFKTCSQEVLEMAIPPCFGLAVVSTATSTATTVRILALGG